uniref:ABC-type nitrate/sulfonate/bicarbonate transport system, periplasmic component n=1 Tax=Desulfovibrio sp. U5L TaxID=596152 RepID=I2PX06_9BACT
MNLRPLFAPQRSVKALGRLAAACLVVALSTASVSAAVGTPIRMAYLQNDLHHLALWVALENGYFTDEGVSVEVAGVFRSGPELMTAFGAGALDAAYVGEAPATIAKVRGTAQIVVLAQANTEGSALVGSKALAAGTVARPTLAIPGNGSVQDFLLRKALPLLHLTPEQVDIIVVSPPEMLTSLQAGQIDGFIAWEPYPSRAVAQGIGTVLSSSADIWPDHPCCVLAATTTLVKDRSQEALALIRAHKRATAFIREQPDQAVAIAVKYTGMSEAVVRLALPHVTYTETPSVAGEEQYVNFLNSLGVIKVDDAGGFTRDFIATPLRDAAAK